jgi:glycine/D-amino acid oxidase-like deaminating enzyme
VVAPLYAQRAAERGARVRTHTEVLGIDVDDASVAHRFLVRTSSGTIRARRVVNCAGGWAGEVAEMVGLRFPIRREGLHVNVTEAREPLLPSMVQHIGRRLTLKQTSHGSFIIGGGWPTALSGYPRRYPTTWQSAAGNLRVALDIVPELESVRVVRTWSGVIAFTDDLSPSPRPCRGTSPASRPPASRSRPCTPARSQSRSSTVAAARRRSPTASHPTGRRRCNGRDAFTDHHEGALTE